MVRPNTAQQRAAISLAIVIPKLLYVARHAWPTEDLIKKADWRIRNLVWNSSFAVPVKAPKGWVQAAVAERGPQQGGIGIPDFRAEIIAMSATVVGDWATSERFFS